MKKIIEKGLTFDDVLLVPQESHILPTDAILKTSLTKKITLNIPLISAAMDTVTEKDMAIAMANEGGIGIIHKNMPIEMQAKNVHAVKKYSSWIIDDPVTISPNDKLEKIVRLKKDLGYSGFPVVDNGKLIGIITSRDIKFKKDHDMKVKEVMTKDPITADENISYDEALTLLDKHRIEKLPVIDRSGILKGLITWKDIEKMNLHPDASKDNKGRLICGAAVGPKDFERIKALIEAGADVIIVDTAHGHSKNVIKSIHKIKKEYPYIQLIGGNIATEDAALALIEAGADAIKVGIGPGSICTTRIISGTGVPQITAIMECAKAAAKNNIPIIADGGIRYSGDIAKAIAAGASAVMIGNLLAGTDESPGRIVYYKGRKSKQYRGMGSISAMKKGSKDRYGQSGIDDTKKLVAEGVEGIVPYKGTVQEVTYQLLGGLKSAMGYSGSMTIQELKDKGKFIRTTPAGTIESHPHDIIITEDAPNYSR